MSRPPERQEHRAGLQTVEIELAGDAQFSRDLAVGGVFVPGCTLRLTDECELIVRGANLSLILPARVVYVEEQRGAGLELIGFSSEMKARLAELEPMQSDLEMIEGPVDTSALSDGQINLAQLAEYDQAPVASVALIDVEALATAGDDDLAIPMGTGDALPTLPPDNNHGDDALSATLSPEAESLELDLSMLDDLEATDRPGDGLAQGTQDGELEAFEDTPVDGDGGDPQRPRAPRNVNERLRGLNLASQIKLATTGELHERVVLERMYGKNVWETLLRNPRLTAPEVARIARYGSLPRVLLEIIVGNGAWLQIPEVRRALLGNPRLATDQIVKVLRLTPKHELKLAAVQTAYPFAVRNAARMLLKDASP